MIVPKITNFHDYVSQYGIAPLSSDFFLPHEFTRLEINYFPIDHQYSITAQFPYRHLLNLLVDSQGNLLSHSLSNHSYEINSPLTIHAIELCEYINQKDYLTPFKLKTIRGQSIKDKGNSRQVFESLHMFTYNQSQFKKLIQHRVNDLRLSQATNFHIDPHLEILYGSITLSFYFEAEKPYKINNLYTQLLTPLERNGQVTFGKSRPVTMAIDNFDLESQKIIQFLQKYQDHIEDKKRLHINANNVYDFIQTFVNDHYPKIVFHFTQDNREHSIRIEQIHSDTYQATLLNRIPYNALKDDRVWLFSPDNSIFFQYRYLKPMDSLIYSLFDYANPTILTLEQVHYLNSLVDSQETSFLIENTASFVNQQPLKFYLDINDDEVLHIRVENFDNHRAYLQEFQRLIVDIFLGQTHHTYKDGTLNFDGYYHFYIDKAKKIDDFILEVMPNIQMIGEVFISDALKYLSRPRRFPLKLGVSVSNGIINLGLDSDIYDTAELKRMLASYRKKKKFHQLKTGERIVLHQGQMQELDNLLSDLAISDIPLRKEKVPAYRMYQLNQLPSEFISLDFDSKFQKMFERPPVHLNEQMAKLLRPYQTIGAQWLLTLRQMGLGGILADDMGLGKSIQMISYLASVTHAVNQPHLIVAPASLLYNWQAEFEKFHPNLTVAIITGSQEQRKYLLAQAIENADVLITSYDYLRRDLNLYEPSTFDTFVIDEAHYIKNQTTKISRAVRTIKANHRFALTGTPIENSLAELWSIFDFLMPGYLYNYNTFSKKFERPILREDNDARRKQLKELVSPFILRRLKKEVLEELPDKIEETIIIAQTQEEEQLYAANLLDANAMLDQEGEDLSQSKIKILAMLTRLRQLALDPRLLYENYLHISSKVLAALELIQQAHANDQKVLLFSSFTSGLELIEQACLKAGIETIKLTGATSKEKRKELVNLFQSGEVPVFLISLKAGGTGLNLTQASIVIHLDPWWNLSAQNQATDRAHRIGQEQTVTVYKLVAKGTIEEKIVKLQAAKKELSDIFVEGSTGAINQLLNQEIRDLFTQTID